MIVVVFRSRLKPGADEAALNTLGARMYALASAMPGFRGYKDFQSGDGEFVSIVEFDTLEQVTAWREHPEHKAAQKRGREEFFADYHIQVCSLIRESRLPAKT